MKKYLYTLCTAALLGLATSCVDSFDATNQNPNKLYLDEIDIQKIFPACRCGMSTACLKS